MNQDPVGPLAGQQSIQSGRRRRRLTPEEKSAIAAEWVACTRTPNHQTMESWARERNLSARQVRSFVRRYLPGQRWGPEIRTAVLKAVASLNGVLETMDGTTGLATLKRAVQAATKDNDKGTFASQEPPQQALPDAHQPSPVVPAAQPITKTKRGKYLFDDTGENR